MGQFRVHQLSHIKLASIIDLAPQPPSILIYNTKDGEYRVVAMTWAKKGFVSLAIKDILLWDHSDGIKVKASNSKGVSK